MDVLPFLSMSEESSPKAAMKYSGNTVSKRCATDAVPAFFIGSRRHLWDGSGPGLIVEAFRQRWKRCLGPECRHTQHALRGRTKHLNGLLFAGSSDGLAKLERAKGFEPSTLTLAT